MTRYGCGEFKTLLYRVLPQAVKGLFAVPGTFLSQIVHDIQQPPEGFQLLFSCVHMLYSFSGLFPIVHR